MPSGAVDLSNRQWDILVRQARRANLLGTLAARLQHANLLKSLPTGPRCHLESALLMVERQERAVQWELKCISHALQSAGVSAIVLKGAAYIASTMLSGQGRIFSDVDILVKKRELTKAESALMIHGWQGAKADAYDQKYYRQWMHEIPPMVHVTRGTTIDVHHSIVPETARVKVDAARLFDDIRPLNEFNNLFVFSPSVMLLHSAIHLFQEGELDNGLRDLFDIDALIKEFGATPNFWNELLNAGVKTGGGRFLYYALRYAQAELGTPVPEDVFVRIQRFAPSRIVRFAMDMCYRRAFRPNHETCALRGSGLARRAIYLRSHWLRMPLYMLIPHLLRKVWLGLGAPDKELPRAQV